MTQPLLHPFRTIPADHAVLGVKSCGCITFIELSPRASTISKASDYGRAVEIVPKDEAMARWRRQDMFDCTECGVTD